MNSLSIRALRLVLVIGALGSLFLQAVMVPLLARDLDEAPSAVRVPVIVVIVLSIACVQVVMVCVWRLLSLVRRGTVFSPASFRYVDVIVGAIAVAACLMFAFGALLAPGEAVAPGVVLLIGGVGMFIVGIALLVVVLRSLLAQAIGRDREATALADELEQVI